MIQLNFLLSTFLVIFGLRAAAQVYLNRLNLSYLREHGAEVPEVFKDTVDQGKLSRISAYTVDSDNFQMVATLAVFELF